MRHTCRRYTLSVVFAALFAVCAVSARAQQQGPCAQPAACGERQIAVSGSAEISVKPDRVHLLFGISQQSKDLKAASSAMGQALGKALAFLKTSGIQDKLIQTSHVSIQPQYRFDPKTHENTFQDYALSQSFSVTLEDTDKYQEIFRGLLDLGVNQVQNVSYSISDSQKYKDDMLAAAVKDAERKAQILANAAGLTLGKAVSIQEGGRNAVWASDHLARGVAAPAPQQGHAGEGFALGAIPVRAEVSVVYTAQ